MPTYKQKMKTLPQVAPHTFQAFMLQSEKLLRDSLIIICGHNMIKLHSRCTWVSYAKGYSKHTIILSCSQYRSLQDTDDPVSGKTRSIFWMTSTVKISLLRSASASASKKFLFVLSHRARQAWLHDHKHLLGDGS